MTKFICEIIDSRFSFVDELIFKYQPANVNQSGNLDGEEMADIIKTLATEIRDELRTLPGHHGILSDPNGNPMAIYSAAD